MKKIYRFGVLFFLLFGFVLNPVCSYAGFLVEFLSGRKVLVETYQPEAKNYVFYLENGILRVSREEVKSIRQKKEAGVKILGEEAEKVDPKKVEPEKRLSKTSTPQETEAESYIKRKAELRERLEDAKKMYFAAAEKAEKDRARQAMTSVARELFSMEEEVKQLHHGSLPEWWKEN